MANQPEPLVTIVDSFSSALPQIINGNPDEHPLTYANGKTTQETEPPKFWLRKDPQEWIDIGLGGLNRVRAVLPMEYLSLHESALVHKTEGDVVRSVALYLLHPINQVLSALHPGFTCRSESASNKVRTDIGFFRPASDDHFAIVEVKKRGVIVQSEFDAANRQLSEGRHNHRAEINQYIEEALSGGYRERTFFGGNSLYMIKQAAAYAKQQNTKYVALFDWDYLVLVYFEQFDTRTVERNPERRDIGDFCRISFIPNGPSVVDIRRALLGFVLAAYDDA
ncbi:hypothetical protein GGR51DRAFT_70739 [Nemania sp. FL0031]|nr:hypothetical protein GGR51DRAFT_70739 [Nemania sp. FL0031]